MARVKRNPSPEAEADSSDREEYQFRLPQTRVPEPIMPGVRGWRTGDDYLVLRLHYTADPEVDDEWLQERVRGSRGGFEGSDWQREMEIDFGSYAGRPVYPQFSKDSISPTRYNPTLPLWRGWDFGYRNPAVVFLQLWPDDTLVYLHELFPTRDKESTPGISTADLAKLVIQETERLFPNSGDSNLSSGVYDFADPAGNQKKETSDFSSLEILQQHGIDAEWEGVGRKNRVDYARIYIEAQHEDGRPRFLINPHCTLGIEAFSAAYRYPDEDKGSADREMPDVSRKIQEEPYIHLMDAFEYVVACNLQVTYPVKTGYRSKTEDDEDVTDLASAYLGVTQKAPGRVASIPLAQAAGPEDLETTIHELIGSDGLDDAWSLT